MIDWTDKRAIGLKCIFTSDSGEVENFTILSLHDDGWLGCAYGVAFRPTNCRLAQGDKTPYDGKGQPVPDGVTVKTLHKITIKGVITDLAENIDWQATVWYQIQEEKL